ncbi:hypothetical protein ACNOYE_18505 [Nannocystaceae bacterium ST9]
MSDDPELRRVAELLVARREGRLAEAETEELALYVDEQPELVEQARARLAELILPPSAGATGDTDRAWLERVHDDRALTRAHSTTWTRAERGFGLALVGGGWVFALFGWAAGPLVALVGVALLIASFLRVRLMNRDPYDRIEQ